MDELLFSLSKKRGDFVVQPFKGSGKGGQKRNKTMSACRIIHPESGAVAECQEERSYHQNLKKAFRRLLEKPEFVHWHKAKCAEVMGIKATTKEEVDRMMRPENLLVEQWNGKKWAKVEEGKK